MITNQVTAGAERAGELASVAPDRSQRFTRRLESYAANYVRLWELADAATPRLGPAITLDGKLRNEWQLDLQFEGIKSRLRRVPGGSHAREAWRGDLLRAARELAGETLGLPEKGLKLLFTQEGMEATRRFVHDARVFDPEMSEESLFQALRNVWVIQSIQLLLGKEIVLTAPAFAYSMLYPWTDNYLDDPQVSGERKREFGEWLEQRLCGSHAGAPDLHAEQVGRLISLIEGVFPRAEFEEVYLSLLAIHRAQIASLKQQPADSALDDERLLQITIRKGGCSVLANAWLVTGRLSDEEADLMFGYGVLLQLMDDLQDVRNDLADLHSTIFSRQAARGPLDALTCRLWSFMQSVLWSRRGLEATPTRAVKHLIQENCKMLLLQACAANSTFYSPRFVAAMETSSPCRFSYMEGRAGKLRNECQDIVSLLL